MFSLFYPVCRALSPFPTLIPFIDGKFPDIAIILSRRGRETAPSLEFRLEKLRNNVHVYDVTPGRK